MRPSSIFVFALVVATACSAPERPASRTGSAASVLERVEALPEGIDPELDRLLLAAWAEAGIDPAPVASDLVFLRRVTLDLTGRIPTPEEIRSFERDSSPDKRRRRVRSLLHSEAWAEYWAEVYTDELLADLALERPRVREATRGWLQAQLSAGRGWDAITTDLLASDGSAGLRDVNGFIAAVGRNDRVEALTATTSRAFLGIHLECAQCHDHPTDPRYTQQDFYGLAAFFGRTKIRLAKGRAVLVDKPRGELRMPTARDGPGMRSGPVVAPRFLGREVVITPGQTRREALAAAVVDSDLFAKAAVHRMWTLLFGRGLVEPGDDLGGEHDASHPPVLEHLARRFVDSGYDHADLLEAIVSSTAYQRDSEAPTTGSPQASRLRRDGFAQAAVRPLGAEPLLRSLFIATALQDARGPGFARFVRQQKRRALREVRFTFADDEAGGADTFSESIPQALLLLHGPVTIRGSSADLTGARLAQILADDASPEGRLDALFLAVYARHPRPDERATLVPSLQTEADYEDLMHAMLLSSEFITNH